MHRSSLSEHGLRIVVAALASLAVAPAAGAEDGSTVVVDPVAMAATLAEAAITDVPAVDVVTVTPVLTETSAVEPPITAPEAVPAAADEQRPALEPQPTPQLTPPPAQPAADPYVTSPEDLTPPAPAPQPAEQPQYQPEEPQYQPPETAVATVTPESAPPETPVSTTSEGSWDWTWSCGDSANLAQPPAIRADAAPKNWNWNWEWNCGPDDLTEENDVGKRASQYHSTITRYRPVNINVSIRIGSSGDDGPVTQTNVVVAVEAEPVVPVVRTTPAAAPEERSGSEPLTRAAATPPSTAKPAAPAAPVVAATEAPSWSARPAPPSQLQSAKSEAHRSRPQLRRPTRLPLPPMRVPSIPVSSAGAAPLGGADGGGFQLALLLVPFALALVDSARRLVRDTAPPVVRERDKRRKRPG